MEEKYIDDEISLKEMILIVRDYFWQLVKSWKIILIFILISLGVKLYQHYTHVNTYTATIRFVVEGQNAAPGGLSGLLGTIGIGKSQKLNRYKILEVGKSSQVADKALYSTEQGVILANSILEQYKLVDKWSESNSDFNDFTFQPNNKNRIISAAQKLLNLKIWGTKENVEGRLGEFSMTEETGIYRLSFETETENMSLGLVHSFYNVIKKYFEDEVFENQQKSVEILKRKVDSLDYLKNMKINQLASIKDQTYGMHMNREKTNMIILEKDIQALTMAYAEVLKNFEMSDINLKNMKPLFIIVDDAVAPIWPKRSKLIRSIIIALFIGGFLGSVFVIGRKILLDILK